MSGAATGRSAPHNLAHSKRNILANKREVRLAREHREFETSDDIGDQMAECPCEPLGLVRGDKGAEVGERARAGSGRVEVELVAAGDAISTTLTHRTRYDPTSQLPFSGFFKMQF